MKMKALRKDSEAVTLTELAIPVPKSGEVLVKIHCAGLCRTDIYLARGELPISGPRTLGHECSGVVCRLGPDVSSEQLGQRVAVFPWLGCQSCPYCLADGEGLHYLCPQRQMLGWHRDGCFAEYLVVPHHRCVPMPDEIGFQAAAFLEPLCAALGILKAPLRQAERIALLGENRFSRLCSTLLTHHAKVHHACHTEGSLEENEFDLIVENQATSSSVESAMKALRPGGVLVLKSRPADSPSWPVRLQVEKEIEVKALAYGTMRMTLALLRQKSEIFTPLWREPVALCEWETEFKASSEEKKCFFTP